MFAKIFRRSVMDNAALYNKYNQLETRDAEELISKFNEVQDFGDARVNLIDIGSGDGEVLHRLVCKRTNLKFGKVIGVDISKEMVEFASKKYGNELLKFHCVDLVGDGQLMEKITKIGVKLSSADVVTSFHCLHWIQDLR